MTQLVATPLAAGRELVLTCGPMVHGGLCLSSGPDGETVFVAGGIPGETVRVALRYRKRRAWFADVVDAVEPSQHRITAPCPYVPDCGGCQLQHVAYEHQLTLKRDILADALRRQDVHAPEIAVAGTAEPWHYRRRGEFHVVRGANGVRDAGLGFNRARSWRPIAVDDCLIHDTRIVSALPVLRQMVRDGGTEALGTLHLTVGDVADELLVRAKPPHALDTAAVERAAVALPAATRLSTDATTLTWRGHVYRVTPEAFVQVNTLQMDVLYEHVITGVEVANARHVVDAYAGIGILPVHLASCGVRVTCIESNRSAARLGVHNARVNDVSDRVHYVVQAAEEALPQAAVDAQAVVLDPPRAGCAGGVTAWLALAGPMHVAYASCDPATLARDLRVLTVSGPYTIERVTLVDMFPHTYHLETVAVLRRAAS